jgi:hypothetical protein
MRYCTFVGLGPPVSVVAAVNDPPAVKLLLLSLAHEIQIAFPDPAVVSMLPALIVPPNPLAETATPTSDEFRSTPSNSQVHIAHGLDELIVRETVLPPPLGEPVVLL